MTVMIEVVPVQVGRLCEQPTGFRFMCMGLPPPIQLTSFDLCPGLRSAKVMFEDTSTA